MGKLKWHKRDHNAALTGMMVLSLEERGAYNTILDLIYAHDGEIKDDPVMICRWMGCDPRTWRRIRARLIDLEKLYVHAGCLHNRRADDTVTEALDRVRVGVEAASKRWATYNEIKGLQGGYPMLTTSTSRKLSYLVPKLKK